MPIQFRCKCGRGIKVRDTAAGKRVKCPDCGSPVRVPSPKPKAKPKPKSAPPPVVDEYEDDPYDNPYAEGSYGDDAYDGGDSYGGSPRRKSSGKKKRKKSGGGVPTAALIVGGLLLGACVIGGGIYAAISVFSGGGDTPVADADSGPPAAETTPPATDTNADAGHDAAGNTSPPPANPPAATSSANSGNGFWVVLSDFKKRQGADGYQISYRVASGKADPSKNYVVFVGTDRGGFLQHYTEVEVIPDGSGTLPFTVGIGMSGSLKAYMAIKKGHQDWEPVSGEIKNGGAAPAAS